jgi:hypothetical protein
MPQRPIESKFFSSTTTFRLCHKFQKWPPTRINKKQKQDLWLTSFTLISKEVYVPGIYQS